MTTPHNNDGGPAFPLQDWDEIIHSRRIEIGMSLRDYFAAAALQGLMNQASNHRSIAIEEAEYCYLIADAMLAARKERA